MKFCLRCLNMHIVVKHWIGFWFNIFAWWRFYTVPCMQNLLNFQSNLKVVSQWSSLLLHLSGSVWPVLAKLNVLVIWYKLEKVCFFWTKISETTTRRLFVTLTLLVIQIFHVEHQGKLTTLKKFILLKVFWE